MRLLVAEPNQKSSNGRGSRAQFVGLVFLLSVPSLYLVEKYLGHLAIPLYVAYVAVLVALWMSRFADVGAVAIGERTARWLALVTFLAIVCLFAIVYPLANSGRFGPGSDSDEALNQATRALLHGRFPYRERTYLSNEISPMPGSLIFAVPFVLLGNAAYQSVPWLLVAAITLRRHWRGDTARVLLFCGLVLTACPAVLHGVLVGTDHAANTLMVLVFALLVVTDGGVSGSPLKRVLCALALGVSLSSRANFVFILPLVYSRLHQLRVARSALGSTALVVGAMSAVTLPFLLFDPRHFSPLHTLTKLAEIESVLPHARLIVPFGAAALSVLLAHRRCNASTADFLRNAAIVEGVVVIATALFRHVAGQQPSLASTVYGQFFLFFGLASIAARRCHGPISTMQER